MSKLHNYQRRDFIKLVGSLALLVHSPSGKTQEFFLGNVWRNFKLTYTIKLPQHGSDASLWVPLPDNMSGYQRTSEPAIQSTAGVTRLIRIGNVPALFAHWENTAPREIKMICEVATRDRIVDLQHKLPDLASIDDAAENYLRPTDDMPLNGVVARTASNVTEHSGSPLQKARAIYDWVVDNTFRDPQVKGCGRGDIKTMLETGNLGGKCADINSLFVGLCRAVGIPAREVYGIRVAESRNFQSLGRSGDVSKAQHCRAEFYVAEAGWVPVDAADVRKAVLEEKLGLDHPKIMALRERLFGSWEMNWVAFNHDRNVVLNANQKTHFLMYPCAEMAGEFCDGLNPEKFSYRIEAQEIDRV